ncbi:GM21561 [Drosophila sechellia]|uniref:TATA box-binding protein-like 1 n=1 Tax=Drosophila sechellia TaxID=7238 RepID=B4IJV6_DROSE|nr:GM21561 [Drosophila sechellia]
MWYARFSVGCHLKLRDIALQGSNVEYRRENGMVTMKLRHPYTTASIWSSGRITCTGATSESMAKVAARRYARCLGKLGFPTRFLNFRIVNVLGTCSMPWAIKIVNFSERHRENASYEPELHPGVTYKMRDPDPKATLKIFSTGSVTVTAASVNHVESAIQHIYPLVFDFRKQRSAEELQHLRQKQRLQGGASAATSSVASQAAHLGNPLKTAALANARMVGAKVTTSTRNSIIVQQPQRIHMQQQHQQEQQQQQFSPSEFDVDDLIEEEENNELDMPF